MSPRFAGAKVALIASALLASGAATLLTGCPDKDETKAPAAAAPANGPTNTEAKPAAAGSAKPAEKGGW